MICWYFFQTIPHNSENVPELWTIFVLTIFFRLFGILGPKWSPYVAEASIGSGYNVAEVSFVNRFQRIAEVTNAARWPTWPVEQRWFALLEKLMRSSMKGRGGAQPGAVMQAAPMFALEDNDGTGAGGDDDDVNSSSSDDSDDSNSQESCSLI